MIQYSRETGSNAYWMLPDFSKNKNKKEKGMYILQQCQDVSQRELPLYEACDTQRR